MRAASSRLGIIAVLIGLMTGPFFHIHPEDSRSHAQRHLAELHSHFIEAFPDDHSAASQKLEIRGNHVRHHAAGVGVLTANARRAQDFVAVLQAGGKVDEPSRILGCDMDIPERVHESPASCSSAPRSPPV